MSQDGKTDKEWTRSSRAAGAGNGLLGGELEVWTSFTEDTNRNDSSKITGVIKPPKKGKLFHAKEELHVKAQRQEDVQPAARRKTA